MFKCQLPAQSALSTKTANLQLVRISRVSSRVTLSDADAPSDGDHPAVELSGSAFFPGCRRQDNYNNDRYLLLLLQQVVLTPPQPIPLPLSSVPQPDLAPLRHINTFVDPGPTFRELYNG